MFFRKNKKPEGQLDGLNPKKDGIDISVKINQTPKIESKFSAAKESVDLENMNPKKTKNNRWKKSAIIAGILIFLVIAWFGGNIAGNLYKIFGGNPLLGFLKGITVNRVIDGESDNRINILIMGRGGAGHPGSDLTDTLMIASLDIKKDKVAMISIPRDLYVEYPDNQGHGRINNIYTLGKRASKNTNYKSGFWDSNSEKINGPTYTKNFISKMLDMPIHYYADMDFNGFEKIINEVGGVTVNVEKSIYDPYYPNRSMSGYEPFYIKAGTQTLNGKTALRYSRSRKTTSDFDRAKRQQQVLVALQDEVKKLNIIKNSSKMYSMLNILGDHVSTDMEVWEMQRLWELLSKSDLKNPELKVFDNSTDGILRSTNIGGASVLLPRAGDYSEMRDIAKNIFLSSESTDPKAKLGKEKLQLTVEVWNGTSTTGLAGLVQGLLIKEAYKISKVGNAPAMNYTNSQIIDYSKGRFPATITYFQDKFNAVIVEQGGQLSSNADILIILGASYKKPN